MEFVVCEVGSKMLPVASIQTHPNSSNDTGQSSGLYYFIHFNQINAFLSYFFNSIISLQWNISLSSI